LAGANRAHPRTASGTPDLSGSDRQRLSPCRVNAAFRSHVIIQSGAVGCARTNPPQIKKIEKRPGAF